MMETELWTYREPMTEPLDIKGFDRGEATDGSIGKIDEATYGLGSSYIVVGYGPMDPRAKGRAPRWSHRDDRSVR